MTKTLFYAYGNPGRQDDALANEVIEMVQSAQEEGLFQGIETDSNYQLNIEDAEIISNYDSVVFVDASTEEIDDIAFSKVSPSDAKVEFTMHAVSTSYVLDLCKKMYHKEPKVFLLHIKGYEWEFMEAMTSKAVENKNKAYKFLLNLSKTEDWEKFVSKI